MVPSSIAVVGGKLPDYPLRAWREARGITLQQMADITGYSLSMMSRIERRKVPVNGQAKIKIAKAVKARVSDLFGEVPAAMTGTIAIQRAVHRAQLD